MTVGAVPWWKAGSFASESAASEMIAPESVTLSKVIFAPLRSTRRPVRSLFCSFCVPERYSSGELQSCATSGLTTVGTSLGRSSGAPPIATPMRALSASTVAPTPSESSDCAKTEWCPPASLPISTAASSLPLLTSASVSASSATMICCAQATPESVAADASCAPELAIERWPSKTTCRR
jgi:hypothetical protein